MQRADDVSSKVFKNNFIDSLGSIRMSSSLNDPICKSAFYTTKVSHKLNTWSPKERRKTSDFIEAFPDAAPQVVVVFKRIHYVEN